MHILQPFNNQPSHLHIKATEHLSLHYIQIVLSDGNEWAVFDNNGALTANISVNQSVTYLSNRFGNNQILVLYGSANGIY